MQRFALALALLAIPAPALACSANEYTHVNCQQGAPNLPMQCMTICEPGYAAQNGGRQFGNALVRAIVNRSRQRAELQRQAQLDHSTRGDDATFAPIPYAESTARLQTLARHNP